jgi:uncharacterized protein (TIGR00251 family)
VIAVLAHKAGAVLPVVAQPGARRNAILGERAGALRIAVTAAPERGKANEAILQILAQRLDISPSRLSLISGASSRQKRVLIEAMGAEELRARLAVLIPEPGPSR